MKIKVKILRFDPEAAEKAPYLQAYDVEAAEGMTVLEALIHITSTTDSTLAFRRSCRSAICGSCAMKINGFPKLACSTQMIPELKRHGDMLIEPLDNFRAIKDLVVDMDPFWEKMERVFPYLSEAKEPEGGWVITGEDEKRIDDAQRCIMCASCNSVCNALEADPGFAGPSALSKAWRFVGDGREGAKRRRLERLGEKSGMWDCVRCVSCTEYCPKEVRPLEAIEKLRGAAIKEDLTGNRGAKHAEAMAKSIERTGRLDEAAMTFKTLGFLRSLGMIPFGIKMELHGKMPHPVIFPSVERMEEVKKIFKTLREEREKEGKK